MFTIHKQYKSVSGMRLKDEKRLHFSWHDKALYKNFSVTLEEWNMRSNNNKI